MTERNLFKVASGVLASTLLAPVIAGLVNMNVEGAASTAKKIESYVTSTATTTAPKDDNKNTNETAGDDAANTQSRTTGPNSATNQQAASGQGSAAAKQAGSYTVKEGDTYGCIAEKYYGSYTQWPLVYNANAGWPGYDEYGLAVGANLTMPAVSAESAHPKTTICG